VRDVIATQRVIATLLLDEDERMAWQSDPSGYAATRLPPEEAAMIARLDPLGMAAMTHSHLVKKERFDYLHRLHHEHMDRQAASAGVGHLGDGHAHDDSHTDGHTNGHMNGHGHDHDAGGDR